MCIWLVFTIEIDLENTSVNRRTLIKLKFSKDTNKTKLIVVNEGIDYVDWIQLAQNSITQRNFVKTLTNSHFS
jgi:hypothetical protein